MNVKSVDLYGQPLFKWVTMEHPMMLNTPMPDDQAAFVYVLDGGCINYSEIEEIKLLSGQSVLAKCGNSTFKTLPVEGGNIAFNAVSVHFHKDVLEKIYDGSTSPFSGTNQNELMVNSTYVETHELIKQYINSIVHISDNQELLSEEFLVLKLKEILLLLLQTKNAPEVTGIMHNLFVRKNFEFREIIKSHICSSISINELAQLTNRSLSSFKKEFKRIYNDTPNSYIIGKRTERVAELLLTTDETISNIAYDCEFKTLAHLSRVFKAKYMVSPSEYRSNFTDKH